MANPATPNGDTLQTEQKFTVTIRHWNAEAVPADLVFLAVQDAVGAGQPAR